MCLTKLLSQIYDFLAHTSLPFIAAADFNQKIQTLTAWTAFASLGCIEGFELAELKSNKTLPPTCRSATKFDSFIIHPLLVCDVWVGEEHLLADHSPIFARVQADLLSQLPQQLYVPAGWTIFDIDASVFARQYNLVSARESLPSHISSQSSLQNKMQIWSRVIEKHST